MAHSHVFITGGGGFIGRCLLERYLSQPDATLYLLEHPAFAPRLRAFLEANAPSTGGPAWEIIEGDVAKPDLGLDPETARHIQDKLTHIMHLAAACDLAAPRAEGLRVTVDGTRHVLDFAEGAPRLAAMGYMSTTAVSGSYAGLFRETDFDVGQGFKNHYEETKFLAEQLVRERRGRLPLVIFRPTLVMGHSQTGDFDKIDVMYHALLVVARNLHWVVQDSGATPCHVVPVDFVAEAVFCLLHDPDAVGGVYHLADPHPMTFNAFMDAVCACWGKPKPLVRAPAAWLAPLLRVPPLARLFGLPPETFAYTHHRVHYDAAQAQAHLARHGVACPRIEEYLGNLVRQFRITYKDKRVRRDRFYHEPGT